MYTVMNGAAVPDLMVLNKVLLLYYYFCQGDVKYECVRACVYDAMELYRSSEHIVHPMFLLCGIGN